MFVVTGVIVYQAAKLDLFVEGHSIIAVGEQKRSLVGMTEQTPVHTRSSTLTFLGKAASSEPAASWLHVDSGLLGSWAHIPHSWKRARILRRQET